MCGIAGIVRFGGAEVGPADLNHLAAAGRRLAHRGPDGQDVDAWGGVGIAFRRLAVYDVAGGQQPLWSEDGTVGLVVNGTIYNDPELRTRLAHRHTYRTRSDCESLVHLYEEHGRRLVEHVTGMFAFAIWDMARGKVLLGRDRLGLKPLYYTVDRERLLFGSEIKALLAFPDCPRDVDWWEVLGDPTSSYALTLEDEALTTGFAGIEQLSGGALLEIDIATGDVRRHQYWDLPEPDAGLAVEDARRRYADLLMDAIDVCLTGEAEIALALSGGVDSAIIAGRAARIRPVHTLTVLSDGTRANGDAVGALEVAESLSLTHTQTLCDERSLLGDGGAWKDMVWRCETALCGPEQLLKNETFKQAKAIIPNLKVMLSGLGGDEFAGGYMTTFVPGASSSWPAFMEVVRGAANREQRRRRPVIALWDAFLGRELLRAPGAGVATDVHRAFQRRKRRDLLMYNLWCEDRLASAHSIEARAPYLDHRLVELLAAIPEHARAELMADKRIVRDAGRSVLDTALLQRPKVPFFHGPGEENVYRPFVDVLVADGHALLEEALGTPMAREVVDFDAVRALVEDLHGARRATSVATEMLFRLVNLGLLDGMVSSGGREIAEAGPAPRITVEDWSGHDFDAAARAAAPPTAREWTEDVLAYAEGAALMSTVAPAPRHYLVLHGYLRFEILLDDPWLEVLRGLDGARSVGELCARAGTEPGAIEAYVATAVHRGILVVVGDGDVPDEPRVGTVVAGAPVA